MGDDYRRQFEAKSNKPPRINPQKGWVPSAFTQISIPTSQTQSVDALKPPKPPTPPMNEVNVGDQIELKNGRVGIVRYVGNIHIKKGIWIGVELNEANGNHDGKIKGRRYFKTAPD